MKLILKPFDRVKSGTKVLYLALGEYGLKGAVEVRLVDADGGRLQTLMRISAEGVFRFALDEDYQEMFDVDDRGRVKDISIKEGGKNDA